MENEDNGAKGDAGAFIRRVRSVLADYHERAKNGRKNKYSMGPTLGDFAGSIHRLTDGVDRFEFGDTPPERVPYRNETSRLDRFKETHESFGLIQFNRVTGGARLFGSHLEQHQHYIVMAVSRASVSHGLSSDHYFAEKELIEVRLSSAQFAEAITSLNSGAGAPCTIGSIDRVDMEDVPEEAQAEHQKIRDGFVDSIEDQTVAMEKARDDFKGILDGSKTISKARGKEMLAILTKSAQDLRSNMPFVVDQFRESADRVVTSAKADIEGFAQLVFRQAGIESIADGNMPKLRLGQGEKKKLKP